MEQTVDEADPDARPDDCKCTEFTMGETDDIPCWPCYRDGFRTRTPGWNDADD